MFLRPGSASSTPSDKVYRSESCQFGFGASADSPMARESILLEANMGPMRIMGRIIGQGNLVEAKAMLKKAGNTIATSQRMVFHFKRFFFSEFFIIYVV